VTFEDYRPELPEVLPQLSLTRSIDCTCSSGRASKEIR
jgi:hypothetical protein